MIRLREIFANKPVQPRPSVRVGDRVWTEFFPESAHVTRRVIAVRPGIGQCNSGWWIEAVDDDGLRLCCDSGWFRAPLGGRLPATGSE
jgi:hypothetical protein